MYPDYPTPPAPPSAEQQLRQLQAALLQQRAQGLFAQALQSPPLAQQGRFYVPSAAPLQNVIMGALLERQAKQLRG